MYRDCEYGDYKDMNNERGWWDDFFPKTRECQTAQEEYNVYKYEALSDIALMFGLDTAEWTRDDYDLFVDMVGIV